MAHGCRPICRGIAPSRPPMNPLKSVETMIANLVEGTFGRVFRTEVRPMELARKLAREMDAHRTVSVSRVYVPNEYSVWLSPKDRERYEGVEHEVIDELCAYLLEHARREDLILASPPHIAFHTDERLSLGEFGIQARLVRPGGEDEAPHAPAHPTHHPPHPHAEQEEHGQTMIYSTSARVRGSGRRGARSPHGPARAARRRRAPAARAPRRRHDRPQPRLRRRPRRRRDLAPTRRHPPGARRLDGRGPRLDQRRAASMARRSAARTPLHPGDRVELGSTEIVFELS